MWLKFLHYWSLVLWNLTLFVFVKFDCDYVSWIITINNSSIVLLLSTRIADEVVSVFNAWSISCVKYWLPICIAD